MNKKTILSLSLVAAIAFSTAISMAETTIYTDGIGRLHFLGKDPGSNTSTQNYSNSAEQDLTRRLYENSTGEINNVDFKVKDYDNTFGIGRMDTQTMWKNKFTNNVDDATVNTSRSVRGSMTYDKGVKDTASGSSYASTDINSVDVVRNMSSTSKKRWWQRSKK